MSQPDEENQLSQMSTICQSQTSDGQAAIAPERASKKSSGYMRLSKMMGDKPNLAMFRRFGSLNALSLLLYQAELVKLEKEFDFQVAQDEACDEENVRVLSKDWSRVSSTDKQWELMSKIRSVVEKYSKPWLRLTVHLLTHGDNQLLVQHKLARLDKPSKRDVEYVREWMHQKDMGFIRLTGPDCKVWRRTYKEELVALDSHPAEDLLTTWITALVVDVYHACIGRYIHRDEDDGNYCNSVLYKDTGITKAVSIVVIGLSAILPLSSIYLLDHFKAQDTRMTILAVYTVGFSIILAAVSGAKRLEVFSAAAAFAAVQVVFISQDGKGPSSSV